MTGRRDVWRVLAEALISGALLLLTAHAPTPPRLYDPPYVRPPQDAGLCARYPIPTPPMPTLPACPPGYRAAPQGLARP